jgi:hypothetical protein
MEVIEDGTYIEAIKHSFNDDMSRIILQYYPAPIIVRIKNDFDTELVSKFMGSLIECILEEISLNTVTVEDTETGKSDTYYNQWNTLYNRLDFDPNSLEENYVTSSKECGIVSRKRENLGRNLLTTMLLYQKIWELKMVK